MYLKPAETVPAYNPDCTRCVALDLDRCENIDAKTLPEAVETPCLKCGFVRAEGAP